VEYRLLGKTGMKVSSLSFGASSLAGGVFRPVEEPEAIRAVATALDLGINFIDVSPFYGITKCETVLGKALRGVPRDSYFLATKVGRYGDDEFDFSGKRTKQSIDESLARMGVDYVDVLQAHDLEYGDLDYVINETLPALREIQKAGKARFIGVTGYPLHIFDYILQRADVDTILSYNHYSINDTTLLRLLPTLKEKGMGVINASPLSQGLLSNRGTPVWHPAPPAVKEACAKAAAWCSEHGHDIAKLAVQFSVSDPEITTTLVGTADPDNIKKNVAWVEEPIDQALLQNVSAMLQEIKDVTWTTGRPENN